MATATLSSPIASVCPICSSPSEPKFIRLEPATEDPTRSDFLSMEVAVVRCVDCSSVFVKREFPESLLALFYKQKAGGGHTVDRENFGWWLQNTEGAIRHLFRAIEEEPRGRLLDVGCGKGSLLYLAQRYGWQPTGLEINREFVNFIESELMIPCVEGILETADLPQNHYQVVVLFDVLEHLYSPVKTLERCKELLVPGGVVVIKSHNWRMQYVKEQLKYRLGRGSGNIATIGHINQFDRNSLSSAFKNAGLIPQRVGPSQTFLPGIRGCEFDLRRTLEYVFKLSFNKATDLVYFLTRFNLAFNLLGIARKPIA